MDIVNSQELEVFLGEDLEFDREFTQKLMVTFKKYLSELVEHGFTGTQDNVKVLADMSHRLKTSCRSFGAQSLYRDLDMLEYSASNGKVEDVKAYYLSACNLGPKTLVELEKQIEFLLVENEKSA